MKLKSKSRILTFSLFICMLSLALTGCVNSSTKYDVVKQTKKDNYTYLNTNGALVGQTVLIGDSIIEIFNDELFDGKLSTQVYNRGISGDTSDRLLARLQDNALNISPANLVLLVGTNDLARKLSIDTISDNISRIVDMCIQVGVENIVVCSLLPVNRSVNSSMVGKRNNRDIQRLNEKLKGVCEQKQVGYADLYTLLADSDGNFDGSYTYDGLHPNVNGYVVMTEELQKFLK